MTVEVRSFYSPTGLEAGRFAIVWKLLESIFFHLLEQITAIRKTQTVREEITYCAVKIRLSSGGVSPCLNSPLLVTAAAKGSGVAGGTA